MTTAVEALRASIAEFDRRIAARGAGGECRYSAKVELLPVQPDARARFVAELPHNYLRDDTSRLNVTPAGLLSSANVVSVDQTGQVLVELAGLSGSLAGRTMGFSVKRERTEAPSACDVRPVMVRVFDPAHLPDEASVNDQLDAAGVPFRIVVVRGAPVPPGGESGRLPASRKPVSGIYYRSPTPVVLELRHLTTTGTPLDAVVLMLPQAGPVSYLPMRASALVKTTNDVQFVDGSVAAWSSERPSEVLSLVRLPAQAIEAFAGALARVLTIRIETSDGRESLSAQQAEEIVQHERSRLLLNCLEGAASDPDAVTACLPAAP
ncbi:hypothetical protein [Brevundimonas sp. R86498]|uniref:hypothetical protein n=1 Tax=Brevundimonas sp. R86498 TaxID=3093845 RepID=UPI0037C6C5F6